MARVAGNAESIEGIQRVGPMAGGANVIGSCAPMMGGAPDDGWGASLRQVGAQDSPPGWAGKDPGGASPTRNLGARWTQMAALRTTLVCSAATPLCVCVRACARLYVCVFACLCVRFCVFPSFVFLATCVRRQRYLSTFSSLSA